MKNDTLNNRQLAFFVVLCCCLLCGHFATSQTLSGMAGSQALRENAMNVDWAYNWSIEPNHDVNEANFEFVPMIWSANLGGIQTQINRVLDLENNYGFQVDHVLGFNEPERTSQANMSVTQAIDVWDVMTDGFAGTGVELVSPAVSGASGLNWLEEFMDEVEIRNTDADATNDLQVDAVAYHWYGDTNTPSGAANNLINNVDNLYNNYGRPVWITEFAGVDFSGNKTAAELQQFNEEFLEIVIPAFEARSYVERYAWWQFGIAGKEYARLSTVSSEVYTPTQVGEVYSGTTLESGESYDFLSGQRKETDVHYLKGGLLTNTGASMNVALRAIDAIEGDSTIEGTGDYELAANLDAFVRIRSGATLRKRGLNNIIFDGSGIENEGNFQLEEGMLTINGGTLSGDGGFKGLPGSMLHLTDTISFTGNGDFIAHSDISGDAGIVKTGSGILYLAGDSTYDGVTSIRSGELVIGNKTGSATGISRIQIRTGAKLSGHGAVANDVAVASSSFVAPGTTIGSIPPTISEGAVVNAIDFDFSGIQDASPLTQTSTLSSALDLKGGFSFGPGTEARNAGNEGDEFNVMGFTGGSSYSDAASANDYLTFSVQAVAGLTMEIDDITFELRRNGSGAAKNYQVFTSIDGFASGDHLGSELVLDGTNTTTQSYTVDYTGGESVSDEVEVRLYGWGATSSFGNTHIYGVSLDAAFSSDPNNIVLDPIGILEIGGNYIQQDFAILEIELSGTSNVDSENPEFDQLVVLGDAEIDGTLDLSFIDGFTGSVGETFDILTANSITGTFSEILLPEGVDISVNYLSSVIQIEIIDPSLSGDFNNDGIVDAADYTLWRDNLGAGDESAINGNGDGLNGIDQADYNLWVANYGATNAPANSTTVPEPSALLLIAPALLAFRSSHRFRATVNG